MHKIKKLEKNNIAEFQKLIEIFKMVFEIDESVAQQAQLEKLLSNRDFFVFVVTFRNEVIGGLTVYVLHKYYDAKPIAYIYDVGITPKFQGKGYGKALMAHVCNFCKQNGFNDAYVEAETEDKAAVAFYRKTKYSSETNAIHFTYMLNK